MTPKLRRHGLLPVFDREALSQTIQAARHLSARGTATSLVCRIASESLSDPAFLDDISRLFTSDSSAAKQIVVSMSEGDLSGRGSAGRAALGRFKEAGVSCALSDVTDLAADWPALARQGLAFVMVDAAVILDPARRDEMARAAQAVDAAGIRLVAGGVERERDIPDLIDHDIPFAQGEALGPARPLRSASDLTEPVRSDGLPALTPQPEARKSLRDVLRRAG